MNAARYLSAIQPSIKSRVGVDRRALGAFRISLGVVIIADLLLVRLPALTTFYTDSGVLPRSLLAELHPPLARWSLHALSGSLWLQLLLVSVTAVAALCLLIGYGSRLAAALSLILLASLHARNPFLTNGGDYILLGLLFCAIVLPVGSRWGVDARQRATSHTVSTQDDTWLASLPTATPLAFIVAIYATNAVFKLQSEAWVDGTAVAQIFHGERFIVGVGPILTSSPTLLVTVNWLWILLLVLSPLLLVLTSWWRNGLVIAFVGAQLGMALTMRLGIFPFVMLTGLLLFFAPGLWDRLEARIPDIPTVNPPRVPMALPSSVHQCTRLTTRLLIVCVLLGLVLSQTAAVVSVATDTDPAPTDLEAESYTFTLFAPNPPDAAEWFVIEAHHPSSERTDLLGSGTVDGEPPTDVTTAYPTIAWHRYLGDLRSAEDRQYESVGAWVCEQSEEPVDNVVITTGTQPVGPDGATDEPTYTEQITTSC